MITIKKFLMLSIAFLVIGCGTPKPIVTKRYAEATFQPESTWLEDRNIDIGVFVIQPRSDVPSKSVFNLSDRGQEAYIKALSQGVQNDPRKLPEVLAKSIAFTPPKIRDKTRLTQSRRLIFSVQKNGFRPGDRVHTTRFRVKLNPSCSGFISWSRFENEHKTIDLGKLNTSQKRTTGIAGSILSPKIKELGDITLSSESVRQFDEELSLGRELVRISGRLEDATTTISQQGAPQIDLEGAFLADIKIELRGTRQLTNFKKFKSLYNLGTPNDPKQISVDTSIVYFLQKPIDVKATLEYDYILRVIENGADSVSEADDKVRYEMKSGEMSTPFQIANVDIQRLFVYKIAANGKFLKLKDPLSGSVEDIQFQSFAEAAEFIKWIKAVPNTVVEIGSHPSYKLIRPTSPISQWKISSSELTSSPFSCH